MRIQEKGSYIFWLTLKKGRFLKVGRLEMLKFKAGFYAYTGSAMGPGGLYARLKHHFKLSTKPHWHIDYLRMYANPKEAWIVPDKHPGECALASLLKNMGHGRIPAPGFGSSDCACPSHLIYFLRKPRINEFQEYAHQHKVPINIVKITSLVSAPLVN